MKKFILIFAVIISCTSYSACATNSTNRDSENFIEKCAEQIIENRIYLKPGYVFIAAKDIFIKVEDDVVPVEAVFCDGEGIYVYDYQLASLIRCDTCKRPYDPEMQYAICPHLPRQKKK